MNFSPTFSGSALSRTFPLRKPSRGRKAHSTPRSPDAVSLNFILGYLALVLAVTGIAIALRTTGIMLAILILGGTIIYCAIKKKWAAAFAYFFAYCALEGLFKYGTNFSQTIYVCKPAIVLICTIIWAMTSSSSQRKKPPFIAVYYALIGIGLVQIFHPLGGGLLPSLSALILWYVLPLPFYFIGFNMIKKRQDLETILWACAIVGTLVAAIGILQWIRGQEWTESHFTGYSNLRNNKWFTENEAGQRIVSWRPASTGSQAGGGSTWAHFGALGAFGLMLLPGLSTSRKLLLLGGLFICYAGMFVSGVRLWIITGVLESCLLVILGLGGDRKNKKSIAIIFTIFTLGGFFLWGAYTYANQLSGGILSARYGETFENPLQKFAEDRGANLTYLPDFITAMPLGVGFQKGLSKGDYVSGGIGFTNRETQFNSIAADMGAPGLILLCWLVAGMLVYSFMRAKKLTDTNDRVVVFTLWSFLLGLTIAMVAGPVWQELGATYCFFTAAIMALSRELTALKHSRPSLRQSRNSLSSRTV